MSLRVKLKMHDLFEDIEVIFCAWLIDQEHENGLPYSAPLAKGMKLRLQWQRYITYFQEWAKDPFMRKNGELEIKDLMTEKIEQRVKFKNALCGDFKIVMDKHSSLGFYYDVWLCYKTEDLDVVSGAEPMKRVVKEYVNENKEPQLIDIRYENKQEEILRKTHPDSVNVIVETKDAIGEFIAISFPYKTSRGTKKFSEKYEITSDIQKIEVKLDNEQ